jgi:hypothetical protein
MGWSEELLGRCWGPIENFMGTHWEQQNPTPSPCPSWKKNLGTWMHAASPHCLQQKSLLPSTLCHFWPRLMASNLDSSPFKIGGTYSCFYKLVRGCTHSEPPTPRRPIWLAHHQYSWGRKHFKKGCWGNWWVWSKSVLWNFSISR